MRTPALVVVAFVAMETVIYGYHRFVMHGAGMVLHRSHHAPPQGGLEGNDLFPLSSALVAMTGFALGFNVGALAWLVPVCLGITLYGLAYFFVHDVYIHRRLPWFTARIGVCERLKEAHRVHHLWHGEPFGMLFPVVPAQLRRRAARTAYDPFSPVAARVNGSTPPHVPVEA